MARVSWAGLCLLAIGIGPAHAQETWAPVIMFDGVNQTVNGVTTPVPNGPVLAIDPMFAWDFATFGNAPFLFPNGFAENAVTSEWIVADTYHGRLLRFATDQHPVREVGTFLGEIPTATGGATFPYGPIVDDQGTIVIADIDAHAVKAFVPNMAGGYDGYAITSFTDAVTDPLNPTTVAFASPYRIAFIRDSVGGIDIAAGIGTLVVLDAGANKIYKLSPSGGIASPAWSLLLSFGESGEDCMCAGPGIFNFPTGLAVDADGNIYISDPNNTTAVTIQVFNSAGTPIQTISQGLSTPWALTIAPDGRLFVADTGNNRIAVFTKYDAANPSISLIPVTARIGSASQPLGGVFLPGGPNDPGPAGELQEPTSLAFDSLGRLLVADTDNARMQIFDKAHLSITAIAVPQTVTDAATSVDVRVAVTLPTGESAMTNVRPAVPGVSFSQAGGPGSAVIITTPSCIITPASTSSLDCQLLTAFPLAPGGQLDYTFRFNKVPGAVGPVWFSVNAAGLDSGGAPVSSGSVSTYAVAIDGTPASNQPSITAGFNPANVPPLNNWFSTQPVLVDLAATVPGAADGVVQEIEYNFGPTPPEEGGYYVCFNIFSSDHPDDASCVIPVYKTGVTTLWYRALSSRGLYDTLVPYAPDPTVLVPGWSSIDINLDFSEPVINFSSATPLHNGWFNQVPSIAAFTVTDTESLVDTVSLSATGASPSWSFTSTPNVPVIAGTVTFDEEGLGFVEVTATDRAGHSIAEIGTYGIDLTPPTFDPPVIAGSPLVSSGGATWSSAPITATFTGHDALSGFGAAEEPTTTCAATVAAGTSVMATCALTDRAGHTTNALAGPFSIDTTPPIYTFTTSPAGMLVGTTRWYQTAPSTVTFIGDDGPTGAGFAGGQQTSSVTASVVGNQASTLFTDRVGNSTLATAGPFNFDVGAPVLTTQDIIVGADVPAANPTEAVVSFSVTAADNVDPVPAIACSPASGSSFVFGVTTVQCTATDRVGNSSTKSFTVTVDDRTKPALTVPSAISQTAVVPTVINYPVTISDNLDPSPVVTCTRASGSLFPLGSTSVSCTATDASGNSITKEFTVTLTPHTTPVCTAAAANPGSLWPPNHQLVTIGINGITNADGTPVSLTIASIFQDEPTNGLGDGDTPIDGQGVGTGTARVRRERSGTANGRVYHINFNATTAGGTCSGGVTVGVPHDQGDGPAVDDGPLHDSTQSPPTAQNDSANTKSGTAVVIDVLGNDSDPLGYALTLTAVSTPAQGTAVIAANKITYTPPSTYVGTVAFTYTVSNGHSGLATATVTVTVKKK